VINALARIMESEVGCIAVALVLAFTPVAVLEVLVAAGVPVGGQDHGDGFAK